MNNISMLSESEWITNLGSNKLRGIFENCITEVTGTLSPMKLLKTKALVVESKM